MKVISKIEKLLADVPLRRRVIILEEATRRATQDANGQEEMWKQCAAEDVDVSIEV